MNSCVVLAPAGPSTGLLATAVGTLRVMAHIRARLTDEAARAWDRTVTREGVTMTALIEALGREMADGHWKPTRHAIELARRIDRERRSR